MRHLLVGWRRKRLGARICNAVVAEGNTETRACADQVKANLDPDASVIAVVMMARHDLQKMLDAGHASECG